jgi:hypothetical protein
MTESRLEKLPHEIQLDIIRRLPMQSVMRLYRTSHYWKYRISHDSVWRSLYERFFGNEFTKDRWILWAIRRLWSQSSSEEERLAARRVSLATLEHLDGYTWHRLVHGRWLTIKNWRKNTPQRIIIFSKDQSDMHICEQLYGFHNPSYGIPFISNGCNKLGFGIIDDALNDVRLAPMPDIQTEEEGKSIEKKDTQTENVLPLQIHDINVIHGRIVPIYSTSHTINRCFCNINEEFVVIGKKLNKQDDRNSIVILAWNMGHLEMHNIKNQSYCVPSLCMAELLPDRKWFLLEQQSGWLLIKNLDDSVDKSKRQYLLYDIRRGRLAASFFMRAIMKPIIGKFALDKVQICYGNTVQTRNAGVSESSHYYWHAIEVSVQSDTPTSTVDLTWYDQTPTDEAIETVNATHHSIMEYIKDQGYWCGEGYLLDTNLPNKVIMLPVELEEKVQLQHLIEDIFLLSVSVWRIGHKISLIRPSSQQYMWSKNNVVFYELVPEEKAIVACDLNGTVQLLDIYTGDILNTFKLQSCSIIKHIIGPLCAFYGKENVLIDVRTGETVRTFKSDSMIQSRILSALLPDVRSDNILVTPEPTHIMYASKCLEKALVYEYAQI